MIVMCRVIGGYAFGDCEEEHLADRIKSGLFTKDCLFYQLSEECQHLVSKMLEVNPDERYSAEEALNHGWFTTNEVNNILTLPLNESMEDRSAMVSSKRMNE